MKPVRVVLEVAPRRTFASAIDFPGWARGGKTSDAALEALVASAPRFARVAKRAKLAFEIPPSIEDTVVVERLRGGSGTEFGVPGETAAAEREPVSASELGRLIAVLEAAWAEFDAAARRAKGKTLTTGPRGGGRTLAKMRGHVAEAEAAYVGQLGSRPPKEANLTALRAAFLEALTARVRDEPLPNPRRTKNPWEPRYAVRRSAWHSLDHAWELDDRS